MYQVLNKQVPVPVPVPVVQVPVQVPVPNLQVPVPVQVLCINYRHSFAVAQSKSCGIFHIKKTTVRTNELQQTQSVVKSVTTVFFDFGWLVATLQRLNNIRKFSSWQQVPVPVLKIQVPVQVPVLACKYKYQYQYQVQQDCGHVWQADIVLTYTYANDKRRLNLHRFPTAVP